VRQSDPGELRALGAKALIFAKFVPGLSIMAPPLAGAVGMRFPRFVGFSILSGALWVGAALLAGVLLRAQIERLLLRRLARAARDRHHSGTAQRLHPLQVVERAGSTARCAWRASA